MIVERPPPSLDYTRFNVYTPLVKSLDLYGEYKHSCENLDWGAFDQRKKALLPNLFSLIIRDICGSRGYGDQLMSTLLLVSPSLREIRSIASEKVIPHFSTVSPAVASLLLKKLTSRCPDLQVLSIFPAKPTAGSGSHTERMLEKFIEISEPLFSHYLSKARQVRELTSNGQIFQRDALPTVASLTLLSRLEIFSRFIEIDPDDILLPENAFPSLQHLKLHLEFNEGTDLWRIDAFRRLTPNDWGFGPLATIAQNSTNLQYLHINFCVCEDCGDGPCDIGYPDLFEELSVIPLKTGILESVWLGPYDPDLYNRFMIAFPEVIELHIPAQNITLDELVHFAKLPKLQHLVLDLYLTFPERNVPPPTPPVGLALHTLETKESFTPTGDLLGPAKLPRAPLLLWPNLQRVVCPDGDKTPIDIRFHNTIMQSLNSFLTITREATKLKNNIINRYVPIELMLFGGLPVVDHPATDSKEWALLSMSFTLYVLNALCFPP
ncbi:unnamed protein product [Rhizoctonia solani]|uniref:Uncharacterized protein n=1 Tax=Rhizoctonia solani TaxID=456999 RepID=A0A8H2X1Y1_9AGAM|nr:unnamed protein product [Rhizoctonia solani]